MAKKQTAVRLSAGELEIMAMLWEEGALTLAQRISSLTATAGRSAIPPCRRV